MADATNTAPARRRIVLIAAVLFAAATGVVIAILIFQQGEGAQLQPGMHKAVGLGDTHIHGLAVDAADGVLYAGTHDGLFRFSGDGATPTRVGDDLSDLMGFNITGPNRFISSGHPASRDEVNPLGLRASSDGGNSWRDVSLRGEVDFHLLRGRGSWVYGLDGGSGLLMVSKDDGVTWKQRSAPDGLLDLAIDPAKPERVIAATGAGMMISSNAGVRWNELGSEQSMLLAWEKPRELTRIDQAGDIAVSDNGGRDWRTTGSLTEEPVAFTRYGRKLFVATAHNRIMVSDDEGSTWRDL